ncbi:MULTISPECIES: hypothetical protein [Cytobacillus]|uniref:Flp pilus assembly protein TadB n=1 Tax=Cytobacillus oceanisediminis TaxID=665099 RepID=A0ABX3CMX7_9BACI|nr:hypothetical protein [Cytobacillus oceanisediminis]EFV75041.1 hypothetical protein HMPREF1013_04686 [Bacillus sp. 2_A_57_CT2]OHX44588.1 hypothetical protein BBV17_25530 [Cytobacillus oceanisediminis]
MQWLMKNYNFLYLVIMAILLFLSWYYLHRSQYDERRKRRFSKNRLRRSAEQYKEWFHNEEYEIFLRKNNLPRWITSSRLNMVRLFTLIILILVLSLELLTDVNYLTLTELITLGLMPLILTPKRPYPFYYIVQQIKRKNHNDVSNEIYQLYNDIKSSFQIKENRTQNSYYTIKYVLPYFHKIRPTLEKMMPALQNKELDKAWDYFANDLDTEEAKILSIVMREVESVPPEQALVLLEQKRKEFSNHLYNRYTDYLKRRKFIIFALVSAGAMTVFFNEITVFFMWYKDVMANVNQNMN